MILYQIIVISNPIDLPLDSLQLTQQRTFFILFLRAMIVIRHPSFREDSTKRNSRILFTHFDKIITLLTITLTPAFI